MLLAIDTSSEIVSIALFDNSLKAEQSWTADQQHTQHLLPTIDRVMSQLNLTPHDLTGIVVALGPGSFNGLRVGLSTAKALSFALKIPLVGIGTLEALAYQYAYVNTLIRPITDAGRHEFNTAVYAMINSEWRELEAPNLLSAEQIKAKINAPIFLCGDVRKEPIVHLRRELVGLVTVPSAAALVRRAGYLAELGARKLRRGEVDDPISLQPIYLRRPAITKSRRQDALAVRTQDEASVKNSQL